VAWLLLLVVQGLLPISTVYLTRALVNRLTAALGGGGTWATFAPCIVVLGLMAGVLLLLELLRGAASYIRTAQAELLQDYISGLIHQKSVALDLAFYESPDYHDRLHRARDEARYRPVALLESVGSILQNGFTLVAMAAVLIPFGLWLPLALFVSTLPALYVVFQCGLRHYQWYLRTTAEERRAWYYDWVLTGGETAAELRLFGLGGRFQALYQALRAQLRGERLDLAKDQGLAEFGAGAVTLLITGGAMAWMVWQALRGLVTLGDLALFYQAFNQGQRLMGSLSQNVGQFFANSLFLGNLFEFLALEPRLVDPPCPVPAPIALRQGIRFEQVTFRYPGSQRLALQDFNLAIPAGQVAALVGPNGSGKSTLIKLLCRFYDPDAGRIALDGIELRHLQVEKLRNLITVLFQQPVHFSDTVAENIMLGKPAGVESTEMVAAARAAGADQLVIKLPRGYETVLGKWFDGGSELSVGEWQRIALARAFQREAPLLLLDEPTSAMDSWAEADWLRRFRRLAAGRTVLLITHRFTTAMRADTIHVMADGRIIESGSHEQLVAQGGRYAQSWTRQMKGSNLA
jgi:ATP-binding cassette subfamily B protein